MAARMAVTYGPAIPKQTASLFEHLRHTNGHVYPDNPDSLVFPEDPSVGFSVGEAILQFFIQNQRI